MILKRTTILLFLFSSFLCFSQRKSVSLKITYTEPYCGGARPTEEMEAEAQKLRPYANKAMVIVSESGKAKFVKTNSSGFLKLKLKPGKYKLFESWRYNKQTPNKLAIKDIDKECLMLEWQKEVISVIVSSEKVDVNTVNDIIVYCPWAIPCLLESAMPHLPQ